jgi:predicted GNAT family N-acyltransferase
MPVYAEAVLKPTEQDLKDIQLIYGRTPVIAVGDHLIGARFNGRLIGALQLKAAECSYQVTELNVREITRRRGVARQLLQNLLKNLPEGVTSLQVDLSGYSEFKSLFTEVGFQQTDALAQLVWQK